MNYLFSFQDIRESGIDILNLESDCDNLILRCSAYVSGNHTGTHCYTLADTGISSYTRLIPSSRVVGIMSHGRVMEAQRQEIVCTPCYQSEVCDFLQAASVS
jgi:hypothetical protein